MWNVEEESEGLMPAADVHEESGLDSFLHQTGTKAACADADTLRCAVDHCADSLKIGSEDPVGLIIGMAHIMPGLVPLTANVTCVRHGLNSFFPHAIR